jgi:iron complex transport system substrate-binding protein
LRIVSLSPTRLGDVLADVERIAAALDLAPEGQRLVAALSLRLEAVRARVPPAAPRPRVISVEWLEPLMLGGTWMPELIALAGGEPLGAKAGEAAPTVSSERLAELGADVVVVKPCGFSLARALEERELIERTIVTPLRGRARVYVTDGNAFFNRPGPRLVESLEIMAACVHPESFADFGAKHAAMIERIDGERKARG